MMGERALSMSCRRRLLAALLSTLAGPLAAQPATETPYGRFIEIAPPVGQGPVHLAVSQVVRIGRLEGETVIDTTSYVQQRTPEATDRLARRLAEAGVRLVALTDPSGASTWVAADRIVMVRGAEQRHAAGARATLVMVGLRYTRDVAVKESVEQVMAALAR